MNKPKPYRILVVEDEDDLARLLSMHLSTLPAQVSIIADGRVALQTALTADHDLLVLDVQLPGMNGLDICRELRNRGAAIPVLMLTARGSELDRVVGLETGADDYLSKPFGLLELTARIRALLRRAARGNGDVCAAAGGRATPEVFVFGELRIDCERRQAWRSAVALALKPREFELLAYFARHPGRVFTRTELLEAVWGQTSNGYSHTVNTHINRIRSLLGDGSSESRYIHTIWGVGYRFEPLAQTLDCAEAG